MLRVFLDQVVDGGYFLLQERCSDERSGKEAVYTGVLSLHIFMIPRRGKTSSGLGRYSARINEVTRCATPIRSAHDRLC
jgi:hypothetical protein